MKKLNQRIELPEDLYKCGFSPQLYNDMLLYEFDSVQEAADFFGCFPVSAYLYWRTKKWLISLVFRINLSFCRSK